MKTIITTEFGQVIEKITNEETGESYALIYFTSYNKVLKQDIHITLKVELWFIPFAKKYPLRYTERSNKPDICFGDPKGNDKNLAKSIFYDDIDNNITWGISNPLKKITPDRFYDLTVYKRREINE